MARRLEQATPESLHEQPAGDSVEQRLRTEQVEQLYRMSPIGLIATSINTCILAFVFRNIVSLPRLGGWVAAITLVTVPRFVQWYRFQRDRAGLPDSERWRKRFIIGVGLSGIVWGSSALVLFPSESIVHQTFLAFVLGGMTAGAAAAFSVIPEAFYAFTLPALIPISLRFLLAGDEVHTAMAAMALLFTILIVIVGKHISSVTLLSLQLRFKNDALIEKLTSSVEQTERLNRELNEHREHLEKQVETRTAELSRMNERLMTEIEVRKKAETEVKQTSKYYQTLIENTLDIITVLEADGTILYESPSIRRLMGYTEEELVGKKAFELIHPDDRPLAQGALARVLDKPGVVESIEFRFKHQNGSWRVLGVIGQAVADVSGTVHIVINSRDVTERLRLEEHLRQAQKLESLGEFAGGLAHDLNNILTGILGNVDIAATSMKPSGEAYQWLDAARKASLQARTLTNQLLTFAKGGEPVKRTISLRGLLEDTAKFVLRGSTSRCEFNFSEDLWATDADEGQLGQVIGNIVLNAVQAMPQGGIVRLYSDNVPDGSAAVAGLKQQRYVRITIEDQGTGIPKEQIDKIFDPFFTTKQNGSGLGLSISYSIIKRHDGTITVASERGMGTAISVYLPASDKTVSPADTGDDEIMRGTGRVLVMDDEAIIRDTVGVILRELGYEPTLVREGAEAVSKFVEARESGMPFDVVILDLTVPGGMGGKDAAARLLEVDPQSRIIVFSGYSEDPVLARFSEYGFLAAVAKPFSVQTLAQAVHTALKHSPGLY